MASGWFGSEICGLPVENERKGELFIALSDGAGNPLLYL